GDPAIPSGQHRRLADLRSLSSFVRAAIVAAVASAESDTQCLAVALCVGERLRLDRPGMAKQRLVLQSAGLAVTDRAWRVVRYRGQGVRPGVASGPALWLAGLYLGVCLVHALRW